MPYILPERRTDWVRQTPDEPGELNWAITMLVHEYVKRQGRSYRAFNEVLGVLEAVKLELYRRVVAPYEDDKMAVNGDVP